MRYALLIYSDPAAAPADGSPEQAAEMQQWFAYTEELQASGAYISGEALQRTDTATTVQVRGGKTVTTDGPFAETKEVLGGFYLIEAADLDEATRWAEKIPNSGYGSIEVRPLVEFPQD